MNVTPRGVALMAYQRLLAQQQQDDARAKAQAGRK